MNIHTSTPRLVAWPETDPQRGTITVKMQSKEYRSFRAGGGHVGQWPGIEVLEAPDRNTGLLFVRRGVPNDVLVALEGQRNPKDEPVRFRQRTRPVQTADPSGSDNPVPPLSNSSISSIYIPPIPSTPSDGDLYEDRKYPQAGAEDAFVRIPLALLYDLGAPPHLRLAAVLIRHSRMRQRAQFKLISEMWQEANISCRGNRARALARLESLDIIRVQRLPGRSPTVSLNIDRYGYARPWKQSPDLKVIEGGEPDGD